ncbi:50S ribosome-binding GTPase domain-containing protein [Phthorimaea operculella]|nr:50S ribosome-binding GTPase domain-containing protein [Phthorimaea operculella]
MIYQVRHILRLCRRQSVFQNKLFNHSSAANGTEIKVKREKTTQNDDFNTLLQNYKDKITFSSYLDHEKLELGYFKYYLKTIKRAKRTQIKDHQDKSLPPIPVSLKYYLDKDRLLNEEKSSRKDLESDKAFQLPFGTTTHVEIKEDEIKPTEKPEAQIFSEEKSEYDRSGLKKWMINYEHFDDTKVTGSDDDEDSIEEWGAMYGTPDPSAGISNVQCGGCGALLHCNDPAIPGYLPSEIFIDRDNHELKSMECQRCHFLKEYNIALDVSVQPEEYEKLLQSIRYVKSLVLLMVDLLDFPCSIWPGVVDIIGPDRPLIIVGNKVDLLPGDSEGYLKRIKQCLLTEISKTKLAEANIRHVALISAKTGYGVEDLISAMFKYWLGKGDVFLVGCTNVGKSSLFNALLQSDYCKVHALDIVKRATEKQRLMVLDEKNELFSQSKWFYDTPGVIHPDQVLSLLSTEELLITIPKQVIKPQTYYLQKGETIFIGGLARIDHVDCSHPCRFTIFCSESLPITVTKTEDADEVYEKFVGTELFAAPCGGAVRLKNWPGLKRKEDLLVFEGEGPKSCCGDVVLSSVAWVGVTAKAGVVCKVAAWTPEGRGIHQRYPSVLPYSVNLKGKRVRDTPAYMIGNVYSGDA